MRPSRPVLMSLAAAALAGGIGHAVETGAPHSARTAFVEGETLSGGGATSIEPAGRDSFARMSGNLPADAEMRFHLGRALFRKLWTAAPSSTQASDGLGPLFNARSCESCHQRDGRGRPPVDGKPGPALLIRLARPAVTDAERKALDSHLALTVPDPVYGGQVQERAVTGLAAEGTVEIATTTRIERLSGGEEVTLNAPSYRIAAPAFGPVGRDTTLSPRLAPPMIGMGLIEAIPEKDIAAGADPDDRDGDGISGRVARAAAAPGESPRIGRFGWKAEQPDVRRQVAAALVNDIGISSPLDPRAAGDCTAAETACLALPTGVQPRLGPAEISAEAFDLLVFYSENLAVPARRKASFDDVLAGKRVFTTLGCAACHRPSFVTGTKPDQPWLSGQTIFPYSDFLLHDMGGALADGQRVGEASGSEWRTPPLWGLGLAEAVNGNRFYLHDGRARSLDEAILWHGGEATVAREAFRAASARDRTSLMTFLESL